MDIFQKFNLDKKNKLSRIFVESTINKDYLKDNRFHFYNAQVLEALVNTNMPQQQQYIDFYSNLVVSESCKQQEEQLYTIHDRYQTNFICVDRELSMKGSYCWLKENWVSDFGNLALNLQNRKQLKARLVRIHIFNNLEKIYLDNIEINNINTILQYASKQGFVNIIASEKVFNNSVIDSELSDIWMIPFSVLVVNTPPLYIAQVYYKNTEYEEVLEKYSTFFLDLIEETIVGKGQYSQLIQDSDSLNEVRNKIGEIIKHD